MRVDGGASLTYEQWDRRADGAAGALVERGLGRRPVGILFASGDATAYAVAWIAVQRAGGVPVMLPGAATDSEAQHLLEATAAAAVLTSTGRARSLRAPRRLEMRDLDGTESRPTAVQHPAGSDVAQVIFTSGTTGNPKGIAASHANLVRPAVAQLDATSNGLPEETGLFPLPLGTNVAHAMLMASLTEHRTWIVIPAPTADAICRAVKRHRIVELVLVPAVALSLLELPERDVDLSSVREIGITGAPMPAVAMARLARLAEDATISNFYSSTEAAPAMVGGAYDPSRPGSIGHADPGTCKIVPVEDAPRADGFAVGEVWLRHPDVPGRWYYGDPARSAEVFEQAGWTKTGDLGYLDHDGFLFLVDRRSDVINVGGMKIGTLEVEEVLHAVPAVTDAAVVGVEHPVLGHYVGAAVVTRSATTEDALRGALRGRLAEHKIPGKIVLVERLPRTANGKVDKRAVVRELLTAPVPRIAPRSDTERRVFDLWRELLGRDDFGILDRFLDVGGHSLLAVSLADRVESAFGVRVPLSRLFFAGSVAELSELIDELAAGRGEEAASRPRV